MQVDQSEENWHIGNEKWPDGETTTDGASNGNGKEYFLDKIRKAFAPFKVRGRRPSKDFKSNFATIFEHPLGPRNAFGKNDLNNEEDYSD